MSEKSSNELYEVANPFVDQVLVSQAISQSLINRNKYDGVKPVYLPIRLFTRFVREGSIGQVDCEVFGSRNVLKNRLTIDGRVKSQSRYVQQELANHGDLYLGEDVFFEATLCYQGTNPEGFIRFLSKEKFGTRSVDLIMQAKVLEEES